MRKEKRTGGVQRYFIASHRTSTLHVVPFGTLKNIAHTVRIVDLSVVGAGIESSEWIERGLACFEESVGGHKFGTVNWCTKLGEGFRAGISFITLPYEKEQYILNRIKECSSRELIDNPENIIEKLSKAIQQDLQD